MNKKWLVAIGAILILAAGLLAGCSPGTLSSGNIELKGSLNSQQEGIWVNGEGSEMATPDIANISLGIEAQATAVADAQEQASAAMDKLMASLKDNGIDEKDIQTQSFNIQRVTRWNDRDQLEEVIGYRVYNVVSVKVRDIDNVGTVIDDAVVAGGDLIRVNNIGFTVDDPSNFQDKAREEAVADAAAKAKTLAEAAGIKLGKPIYITESSYSPSPIYRDTYLKAEAAMAPAAGTSISAGELEITVNVQIAYEID